MKVVVSFEADEWDNYDVPYGDTDVLLDLLGELLTEQEMDTVTVRVAGVAVDSDWK